MTSAVRPKPKTTAKTPTKAAPTSRTAAAPSPPGRALPAGTVTQLELVELLHKGSLIEIIIAEVEPARYQIHLVVIWHFGRSVLAGSSGQPRTFRSLDTLRLHLKTLGIGSTLVRLELLA
ncbi:hypothetical protein [Variovorax sp. LARHSF232]